MKLKLAKETVRQLKVSSSLKTGKVYGDPGTKESARFCILDQGNANSAAGQCSMQISNNAIIDPIPLAGSLAGGAPAANGHG